jgi:hypothetical protein
MNGFGVQNEIQSARAFVKWRTTANWRLELRGTYASPVAVSIASSCGKPRQVSGVGQAYEPAGVDLCIPTNLFLQTETGG